MRSIKVTLAQLDTLWLNPNGNLKKVEEIVDTMDDDVQILVLPEMFSTGYCIDTSQLNINWQNETLDILKKLTLEKNTFIIGSIPYFQDVAWFNRLICVSNGHEVYSYHKIHLFGLAKEDVNYTSGQTNNSFSINDISTQALVCYDLRFPYLNTMKSCPKLIIYSANWPATRITHWKLLLQARAIENQAYVIGVNRVGTDDNGYLYSGDSMIISFDGQILGHLGNKEETLTTSLNMNNLEQYRDKYPYLKDRKISFDYQNF